MNKNELTRVFLRRGDKQPIVREKARKNYRITQRTVSKNADNFISAVKD